MQNVRRFAKAPSRDRLGWIAEWIALLVVLSAPITLANTTLGQGQSGKLVFRLSDETDGEEVISRVLFSREGLPIRRSPSASKQKRLMPIRRTVSAGIGVVVDRSVDLELPEAVYQFQVIRGPEYRIVNGTFTLEKTSSDEKTVSLPRMVDMQTEGWLSGDACVVPSSNSLPLRMAAEDLHVAAVIGKRVAKPIPGRDSKESFRHQPLWIHEDASHHQGLLFYGRDVSSLNDFDPVQTSLERLASVVRASSESPADQRPSPSGSLAHSPKFHIGIENPFAWELPVLLASDRIDGIFVLGDWLRLDRQVFQTDGRNEPSFSLREPTQLGRFGERIYRHAIDAGIPLVPLAGGGDASAGTPVGYNRIYAAKPQRDAFASPDEWWQAVWDGQSVVTNGPMLRPMVSGFVPGHTFRGKSGETLRLAPELNLAVRDPVEYLEVLHDNRIHYSARLREFAAAGGMIPPIEATQSGWVMIRVVTLYEGHYRAAVSAPWWIEFDGKRRVSKDAVGFFQDWLSTYESRLKRLPKEELSRFVPFVVAARKYWSAKASIATD